MPLLGDADSVYHNGVPVNAIYAGGNQVWPLGPKLVQVSPTELAFSGGKPATAYAVFHSNPIMFSPAYASIPDSPYSPSGFKGTITTDSTGRATVTLGTLGPAGLVIGPLDQETLPGGKYSIHEMPPPALRLIEKHNELQGEYGFPTEVMEFLTKATNGENVDNLTEPFKDYMKKVYESRLRSGKSGIFSEIFQRNPDEVSPEFAGFLRGYQQPDTGDRSPGEKAVEDLKEFFKILKVDNLPPEFTEMIQILTAEYGFDGLSGEDMPPEFTRKLVENLDVNPTGPIGDLISYILYLIISLIAWFIAYFVYLIYYWVYVVLIGMIEAIIDWINSIEPPDWTPPDWEGLPPGTIDSIADILMFIVLMFVLVLLIGAMFRVSDGIADCYVDGEMIVYRATGYNYKSRYVDSTTNLIAYVSSSVYITGYFYCYSSDYHHSTNTVYTYRTNLVRPIALSPGWSFEGSPGLRCVASATQSARIKYFTSPMTTEPVVGQPWNIETELFDTDTDKATWDALGMVDVDNVPAGVFDGTLGLTSGPRDANPPTGDAAWFIHDPTVVHTPSTTTSRYGNAYPRYRIKYTAP